MIYVYFVLTGLVSGIFGGLGMGGGTILIPILTIFLGLDQKLAQGINLFAFLIMAIFSLLIHYKNGYIKSHGLVFIILFGVIFSIVGSILMSYVPSKILKIVFGAFLIVLSGFEFAKVLKK